MTRQQENWIEKELERYRERLENEDIDWIERRLEDALEEAEEKERERIDDLNAMEKLSLHGAAYQSHIKKFLEDTREELTEHFKAECDEKNEELIDEYRQELEAEIEGEDESEGE